MEILKPKLFKMEQDIFKRIENSKKPDFGDVLSKSFDLYKKTFSQGIIHSLISLVVVIPFVLVMYIPLIPMYVEMFQYSGDPYYSPNPFEDYSIILIVVWFLLMFVLSFLMQVVNMSIYGNFFKILKNADTGTTNDTGGYFTLLKTHFNKLLLLSLATFGIALLATLLCYLPVFYVIVPLQLTLPIFVFNDKLGVKEIINASFKLGNKYWLLFFGLLFIGGVLASLGIIACYIGIFFTMFFTYIVTYYMYKDSIGFDDEPQVNTPEIF